MRARPRTRPLVLGLLLRAGGVAHAAPAPDFAKQLPLEVSGWKRPARPQVYDASNLYEYLDGGAELYISFGVRRVLAFFYEKGKDREIKVDVFDMGTSHNAFGIFAHGRERIETEVGQGSEYSAGLLTFWKDRYYVSVLGYPETEESRAVVRALGRAVAALVPRNGPLPPLVGLLPRPHLVPASVRYFRHHVWLNSACFVAPDNLLGIGKGTEAVLARYAPPGGKHVLVLVEYADAKAAASARRTFAARYLGSPAAGVTRVKERFAGIRIVGRRAVVVLDAPSRAVAEQALGAAAGVIQQSK
ncbi:MAG: hypothetical protein HY906_22770 [Deltaproteobacteria bacterium]|nr:hypothetical protein [Deltaproteobacteria bacterium]